MLGNFHILYDISSQCFLTSWGELLQLKYKTKIEQWKHFETQDIDYIEYKTK
jgi:hypothetical protein